MIVLGIDTSGYINAVGVVDGARVLADNRFPARTDTLEQIVDNIDVTLKHAGVRLADVEGIGVGLGPGSWTGIKVGVTVGKMLAFSAGKPVAGIPTLDALAYGVPDKSLPVYAVIGAGVKDMVYAARYSFKENEPVRQGDYFAGDVKDLTKVIHEPVIFTGQGISSLDRLENRNNEPVGDTTESAKGALTGDDLHNAQIHRKFEPVADSQKYTINDSSKPSVKNEPAGSRSRNVSGNRHDSDVSDILVDKVNYPINEPAQYWKPDGWVGSDRSTGKNEPAQSWVRDEGYTRYSRYYENEPAGAWIAHLALLRLQSGLGDNPLVLAPMYLKESTAKVFTNKYAGKKDL
jgi:tRNA threonylcarbamoyladenosine biosynthesis protein TsaB